MYISKAPLVGKPTTGSSSCRKPNYKLAVTGGSLPIDLKEMDFLTKH